MIECIFGWKQHGTLRKTKHRGIRRIAGDFLLNLDRQQSGPAFRKSSQLDATASKPSTTSYQMPLQASSSGLLSQQPTFLTRRQSRVTSEVFQQTVIHHPAQGGQSDPHHGVVAR